MDRRTVLLGIGGTLLAAPFATYPQKPATVWRVGFLSGDARPADGAPPLALRQALEKLGYVDGKDVTFVSRWADANSERLPGFAAELVGLDVDLLLTIGDPASRAAKEATSTIPIVFVAPGDAAETGLVKNLARPEGNVTGISDPASELSAKRLGLLKEAVPHVTRVAVIWNADDRAMTLRYRNVEKAARDLHVTIDARGVRNAVDIDAALAAMSKGRPDAVLLLSDALTGGNRKRVLDFAAAQHIPAMY